MILNLTQHHGTTDQGVVEPTNKTKVIELLTFNTLPTIGELNARASELAIIAVREGADEAMIGGAPYLMAPLEGALYRAGVTPVYAFSVRESKEEILPDGNIKKISVFKHAGWIRS